MARVDEGCDGSALGMVPLPPRGRNRGGSEADRDCRSEVTFGYFHIYTGVDLLRDPLTVSLRCFAFSACIYYLRAMC